MGLNEALALSLIEERRGAMAESLTGHRPQETWEYRRERTEDWALMRGDLIDGRDCCSQDITLPAERWVRNLDTRRTLDVLCLTLIPTWAPNTPVVMLSPPASGKTMTATRLGALVLRHESVDRNLNGLSGSELDALRRDFALGTVRRGKYRLALLESSQLRLKLFNSDVGWITTSEDGRLRLIRPVGEPCLVLWDCTRFLARMILGEEFERERKEKWRIRDRFQGLLFRGLDIDPAFVHEEDSCFPGVIIVSKAMSLDGARLESVPKGEATRDCLRSAFLRHAGAGGRDWGRYWWVTEEAERRVEHILDSLRSWPEVLRVREA